MPWVQGPEDGRPVVWMTVSDRSPWISLWEKGRAYLAPAFLGPTGFQGFLTFHSL